MGKSFDLILSGGELVNHDGVSFRDVGVIGGRIAEIGDLARASAGERVDCRGLTVLPGVIDSQVHFREPGLDTRKTSRPALAPPCSAASPRCSKCPTPSR